MTVKEVLRQAEGVFVSHGIEDARLESKLLLRHTLSLSQVQLYQEFDRKLGSREVAAFRKLVKCRLSGEPSAYITGHREFYGLDFYVDRGVLIPRPETELLVEKALQLAQSRALSTIADIGTGCGAIAVSLARNLPQSKIYATDVSAPALRVAFLNCQKHGVAGRVALLAGNLLDPLPEPVDLIVANLPYVREVEVSRMGLAKFEPETALNGGQDGLEQIRCLCRGAGAKLRPGGALILEIGEGQGRVLTAFLRDLFPLVEIEVMPDLSGIDRVISITLR